MLDAQVGDLQRQLAQVTRERDEALEAADVCAENCLKMAEQLEAWELGEREELTVLREQLAQVTRGPVP